MTSTNPTGEALPIRPWESHERNYSGGRFGVWFDGEWTMLRVEAGIADATASIRKHEAWDLALRLSPALKERLEELFDGRRKAEAAVYQFTYAENLAPLLRKIADEWDCDSSQCEFASSDLGALVCPCMEDERGCRAVEADELRQFADALETKAAIAALRTPEPITDATIEAALTAAKVDGGEWLDSHKEAAWVGIRLAMQSARTPEPLKAIGDDQIKHMANRFLCWRLPENFHPDAGISFKATFNDHLPAPMKHNPTGTNLFDAEQAEAMVRHMLEGLPEAEPLKGDAEAMCQKLEARDQAFVSCLNYARQRIAEVSDRATKASRQEHYDDLVAMGRLYGEAAAFIRSLNDEHEALKHDFDRRADLANEYLNENEALKAEAQSQRQVIEGLELALRQIRSLIPNNTAAWGTEQEIADICEAALTRSDSVRSED